MKLFKILYLVTEINNRSVVQEHPGSVGVAIATCNDQSSPPILSKVR